MARGENIAARIAEGLAPVAAKDFARRFEDFAYGSGRGLPALRAPGGSGGALRSYGQSKRIRNLYLTRERDRRRGRELATFLLAGLPIACALFLYAALHVETVRVGYAREARVKRAAELTEKNRLLKAELARASSPARVSAVATRKGLVPPRPGQIQYIEIRPGKEGGPEAPSFPRREAPIPRREAN